MDSAKSIIRARMKKSREDYFKSLSETARVNLNQKIGKNILSLVPAHACGSVAGFWPMSSEPDIRSVLETLILQGCKALLPVTQGAGSPLSFRVWKPGDQLRVSSFKTMEPLSRSPLHDPEVILVPLLAFDGRGHRLGYGAGHYDRTLSQLQKRKLNVLTIGVAFEIQRVNELPMGSYDQPLGWVVTEKKVYKFI